MIFFQYPTCFFRKKGKKGSKKNESIAKIAAANSKVWETRLEIAETSKQEYRYISPDYINSPDDTFMCIIEKDIDAE